MIQIDMKFEKESGAWVQGRNGLYDLHQLQVRTDHLGSTVSINAVRKNGAIVNAGFGGIPVEVIDFIALQWVKERNLILKLEEEKDKTIASIARKMLDDLYHKQPDAPETVAYWIKCQLPENHRLYPLVRLLASAQYGCSKNDVIGLIEDLENPKQPEGLKVD